MVIILAVFAVIGIALLGVLLFDALYFKGKEFYYPMVLDFRYIGPKEAWEILESISMAKKYPGGRSILCRLILVTRSDNNALPEDLAWHYLRVFDLSGTVFDETENWADLLQKTPEKEGT